MANTSILNAFERMWQHITIALNNKSDANHNHDDVYYQKVEIDNKLESKADVSDIPDALSDLTADSTHRTVTDEEKATWDAKSDFSGNYNDLTNKPSIPSIEGLATETYVNDVTSEFVKKVDGKDLSTNDYTTNEKTKLAGIEDGAQVNTVIGVKGDSETSYRTGNINITKANIGLENVDNTADAEKRVSHAVTADSATKATQDASGNVITSTYETKADAQATKDTLAAVKEDVDTFFKDADLTEHAKDTLKEIQEYIDSDVQAAAAMAESIHGKANKEHDHTVADITDLTVTAAELNYVDGVTDNIQTQLDGKADSDHTHVVSWGDVTDKPFINEGGDTLTWDGDMTGRLCVDTSYDDVTCYNVYVSDAVPTMDDLSGGATITLSDGSEVTASYCRKTGNTMYMGPDKYSLYVYIALDDNADDLGINLPQAGVYFGFGECTPGVYTTSLTISGYTGFATEKLELSCLPEHTHEASEVGIEHMLYVGNDEPVGAKVGDVWIDMDDDTGSSGGGMSEEDVEEIIAAITPASIGAPTVAEMNAAISAAIGAALEASY
jgi:hypothetical protein